MKAISLWQPHASMIPLGIKGPETRGWRTSYRGPLAIHATATIPGLPRGQTMTVGDYEITNDTLRGSKFPQYLMRGSKLAWPYRLPLGAVVATCELVDVVPVERIHVTGWVMDSDVEHWVSPDQRPYGDYSPGRFAWLLDNIVPLDFPIPAKGKQGLWGWEVQ